MAPNTILLKGDPIHKEGIADEAITPGHLLEKDSSNGKIQKHSTAGGNAQKMFAMENDLIGDGITTDYAAGDQVLYIVARPGDEVYGILTTSQTIKAGDALESAGNGTLRKHTPLTTGSIYVQAIVGYAVEDKTTTAATARIRTEVA